jgi:pSer/pThr/pTyr-binding forkhead associated (FHA) protein
VPRLLIIGDDGNERAVELNERTVQIGRGPGNDVVLPDAHKGVSRTHAELRFRNGRCVLVDLQSQNGTFLNGQRVEHAEVPVGAEIGVGSYRLRIERIGAGEGPEPGAEPPPSTVGYPSSSRDMEKTGFHDLQIIRANPDAGEAAAVPADAPSSLPFAAIVGALLIVAVLGAGTWLLVGRSPQDAGEPSLPMPDVAAAAAPATPAEQPSPLPASPTAEISRASGPADPAPQTPPGTPVATPGGRGPTSGAAPAVRAEGSPVARKPGETAEAWQIRTAAFQTRYAYSRAALDRGDFAAAAGGLRGDSSRGAGFSRRSAAARARTLRPQGRGEGRI